MASLWKDSRTRYWVACFTDAAGRRLKRSTKSAQRKEAQRIADSFEEASRKRRTARQVREVISGLHQWLTGEEVPAVSLRSYVGDFLARKAPETAPATLAAYRKSTAKLLAHLGAAADKPLDQVSRADIEAFRNANARTVSAVTANNDLKALRVFFRAARRDGLLSDDPAEFVATVRAQAEDEDAKRQPFTLDELRTVLALADAEWRSLIFFGLYSGQRLGDLARLTWANVDLEREEIRLKTAKTGRRVRLPLAGPLRRHLADLAAGDDPTAPLHPRAFGIVQRTRATSALSGQFADLLAAAGLRRTGRSHRSRGKGRDAAREREGLSFHSLRHTATTLLHDAGLPPGLVQSFIGHDSSKAHETYRHVGRDQLARAAAALPDLLGEPK